MRSVLLCFSISQSWRLVCGSMPALGSSKKSTRGLPSKARATFNFLFMPPDREDAAADLFGNSSTMRSTSSQADAVASSERPMRAPKRWTCSSTVKVSHSTFCCMQNPICLRTSSLLSGRRWPKTSTSPEVCGTIPVSTAIVVLLPAPLWPNKQKHSPWYIVKFKPSTALTLTPAAFRNSFFRSRTLTTNFLARKFRSCSEPSSSK
mmetsp:Transcript_45107/g.130243  ORF Transcript_45107/g.130243 Transcript_45107/m.130243 type:complete len:206 (-) Transcript_45107:2410-3027(-)